jgi:pyruvate dehydrogenase E1 component
VERAQPLKLPGDAVYAELKQGAGGKKFATTMATVRLLKDWMKDPEIGKRIVPIAPDEYRTFGMDSFFPSAKIYNPLGQQYEAVDRDLLLAYKESPTGQMLHDGISEAGCTASLIAAGSAYATHGEPLIPVYVFYSMFGFQRTGDQFWQMADQLARGFVLGATAGRTTLTGEGLQHADGHSQLLASTNPGCVAYDPAFGFEIAHIVKDGLRRMYGETADGRPGEDVFYYLTVYNEPIQHPAEPADVDVDGILKGIHRFKAGESGAVPAQIIASGVAVPWAVEAQQILAAEWNVKADVWSATSWNELRREAVEVERHNLLHPEEEQQVPYVTRKLSGAEGPFVAVSDWMRSVPDQIARWVPGTYQSLGADGFGFADTRGAARRYFHIDAQSIVVAVLTELAREGKVDRSVLKQAIDRYQLLDVSAADPGAAGGDA